MEGNKLWQSWIWAEIEEEEVAETAFSRHISRLAWGNVAARIQVGNV